MTIEQVQALIATLEANITTLLQAFQTETGLTVHSVPVTENSASAPVVARVKVLL